MNIYPPLADSLLQPETGPGRLCETPRADPHAGRRSRFIGGGMGAGGERPSATRLEFYHFSAITNISKSSVVSSSFRLKAPSFAPNIFIVLKFNDFNSQLISDGT